MTWRNSAACLGSGVDFFDHEQTLDALNVCAGCDVTDACLDDAIKRNDRQGVRGGVYFLAPNNRRTGKPRGRPAKAAA